MQFSESYGQQKSFDFKMENGFHPTATHVDALSSYAFPILPCTHLIDALSSAYSIYTEKLLHRAGFHTQQAFTHSKPSHTASFYTQQAFAHSRLSQPEAFTNKSFHTQAAFTLSSQRLMHGTCCRQYSFGIRSTT